MAIFFKISNSFDVIEVEELLLHRYANIDYILNLPFKNGYELICKAFEKSVEEQIWQRWLIDYQKMTKENFMSFTEYQEQMLGPLKLQQQYSQESKESILAQAEEILQKISQKEGE